METSAPTCAVTRVTNTHTRLFLSLPCTRLRKISRQSRIQRQQTRDYYVHCLVCRSNDTRQFKVSLINSYNAKPTSLVPASEEFFGNWISPPLHHGIYSVKDLDQPDISRLLQKDRVQTAFLPRSRAPLQCPCLFFGLTTTTRDQLLSSPKHQTGWLLSLCLVFYSKKNLCSVAKEPPCASSV